MASDMKRRRFLQVTAAGAAGLGISAAAGAGAAPKLVSPGCRGTKVPVARLYLATGHGLWPTPKLDFEKEIAFYESEFGRMKSEFADVDFAVDELVTSPQQVAALKDRLARVDGILAIHFNIGVRPMLDEILSVGKPTILFARPFSGHGWVGFGALQKQPAGARLECLLTSDFGQLAFAVRPFRAIHHLREAKILNVTARDFGAYAAAVKEKFGTEIAAVGLERVLDACNSVSDADARAEAQRWIEGADRIVEPPRDDIVKSCTLALAFERLLDEEGATVMTADCYGSMHAPLCRAFAYPCIGFTRLNDMGYGGICESDLQSAMTHVLYQGLAGRPGFISDPTVDESNNTIILAHCLGTRMMDGPAGPPAPYKLRTIMERQEGVVPQVEMRVGQKVTQAILLGTGAMPYFTGEIVDAPVSLEHTRGCRTKITVRVDGDVRKLWKNWSNGLHRQTCYGDISRELEFFCRFKDISLVNEAV